MSKSRALRAAVGAVVLAFGSMTATAQTGPSAAEISAWIRQSLPDTIASYGGVKSGCIAIEFYQPCFGTIKICTADQTMRFNYDARDVVAKNTTSPYDLVLSSSKGSMQVDRQMGDGGYKFGTVSDIYIVLRDPSMRPRLTSAFNALNKACGGTGPVSGSLF